MEYTAFKDALFAQAKAYGFTDYELYFSASNSFTVRIFNREISEYNNTDVAGASFRGTFNGRMGYAYTENLTEAIIPALVKNAAANAAVIEEEEIEKLYPGDKTYPTVQGYHESLAAVSADEKIQKALAMEKAAYDLDSRVKSVDYCVVGSEEAEVRIANSYGLDVAHRQNMAYGYVLPRVEADGVTKTGFEYWVGHDMGKFDCDWVAKRAVDNALAALGAASIPSGAYPVILDDSTARDLFATFADVFYAENVQKGFSLLKDKTGTAIAAPHITLRDDGVCDLADVSTPFDSEGVATQNKAVIENGVLKTLLYNTKTAEKDGVKSTGNGFKPSFRAAMNTSCTNFYIPPSDKTPEQLMAGVENGLLITQLAGLHSGANTVSGDFSLSADGFLIENGQKGRPVEQITVAGNFYDLLQHITAVGNNLRFAPPSGAGVIGMPSLRVDGLRISGL